MLEKIVSDEELFLWVQFFTYSLPKTPQRAVSGDRHLGVRPKKKKHIYTKIIKISGSDIFHPVSRSWDQCGGDFIGNFGRDEGSPNAWALAPLKPVLCTDWGPVLVKSSQQEW